MVAHSMQRGCRTRSQSRSDIGARAGQVSTLRAEVRNEKDRAERAQAKFEEEVKRGTAAARSGSAGAAAGGASDAQVRDLREQVQGARVRGHVTGRARDRAAFRGCCMQRMHSGWVARKGRQCCALLTGGLR
jgi:hypothetical protein